LLKDPATFDEAEQYINAALDIDENQPDALVSLGRVFEKKGNTEEAQKCYEKALR